MLDRRKGSGYILLKLLKGSGSITVTCHSITYLLAQVIVAPSEVGPLPVFIPPFIHVLDDIIHPFPIRRGQTGGFLELGVPKLDCSRLGLHQDIRRK